MKSAGVPERYTLVKHLRRHGKATPAHVWANRCRWCHLDSWWWAAKRPVAYDSFDILQQRVTALEKSAHSDGSND